jgi:hypothetical protein
MKTVAFWLLRILAVAAPLNHSLADQRIILVDDAVSQPARPPTVRAPLPPKIQLPPSQPNPLSAEQMGDVTEQPRPKSLPLPAPAEPQMINPTRVWIIVGRLRGNPTMGIQLPRFYLKHEDCSTDLRKKKDDPVVRTIMKGKENQIQFDCIELSGADDNTVDPNQDQKINDPPLHIVPQHSSMPHHPRYRRVVRRHYPTSQPVTAIQGLSNNPPPSEQSQ